MGHALIIVDFQNDFTPGGALAVAEGDQIESRVRELAESGDFDLIVATRDWHPPDHFSFEAQGGPWPPHCVQDTEGAELRFRDYDVLIDVGVGREDEGYSAFENSDLERILRERGIDRVTVVGLATDYCVKATAIGAAERGLDVTVDPEGVRPVEVELGDGERALEAMRTAGVTVAS
jgi:nicotinamidase/pyrazinamidase